jgi:hypothetical protein
VKQKKEKKDRKKEKYLKAVLTKHNKLRDITAGGTQFFTVNK